MLYILSSEGNTVHIISEHFDKIFLLQNGIYARMHDSKESVVLALYEDYKEKGKVLMTGKQIAKYEFERFLSSLNFKNGDSYFAFEDAKNISESEIIVSVKRNNRCQNKPPPKGKSFI